MKMRILFGWIILLVSSAPLVAASQNLTAEGKKNLTSAEMHLSGGRYEKAMPFFELVLQENPHHIEAMNKLAGIYYDTKKDYKKAQEIYSAMIIEIDEIFAEYESLLQTDEKEAKKFHKKNIKKANLEETRDLATKLIQSCWVKLFKDAQEEFEADSLQSSLDKFIYLLEIAPDSVQTLKMISFIHSKMGDEEKSLEFMIQVAEIDSDDDIVRTQIGNSKFESGNYESAINWYKAAAEINPGNVDNYFNMALAYNKIKDQENTLQAYQKVLELEPDNLDALLSASNIQAMLGNLDSSINYLKSAIALQPTNVSWISFLTYKLAQEKRFNEVLEYANKWKELEPDSDEAQQMINVAKQNLK